MPTPRYHINVFYSAEDKAFIADVPDLKYCSAHGKTPEAAVREVQVAMRAWLKAAKAHGKRIPKPRYRPAIYQAAC
ncbi:MAG: type II toxin-antitoxin system HicB family antitoxin [Phycisphaerales bacterium]